MFSFLREEDKEDGKPGPLSGRRIAAFLLLVCAIYLFHVALPYSVNGWFVFIPGIACLVLVLFLFFFTTWDDVAKVTGAIKGNHRER